MTRITPTWPEVVPLLRQIIENAGPESRELAWKEIERMAEMAQALCDDVGRK